MKRKAQSDKESMCMYVTREVGGIKRGKEVGGRGNQTKDKRV